MLRVLSLLIVAVLAAGCAGSSRLGSAPPSTSSPPSATPTVDPSPSPTLTRTLTPAPTPAATSELRFERVAVVDDADLYDVVEFGGGFVAAGCRLRPPSSGSAGGCAEALVMHSPDGRAWADAVVSGGADRRIVALAETPLGLLAFGSDQAPEPPLTRALWRSDDGTRWEPFAITAPESIVFTQAVVLEDRTVLLGYDSAYDLSVETQVWATTDGRSWTSGTTPMSPKVAGHPGLVAIGHGCIDLCPDDLPLRVFRSIDGLEWTQDEPDPALEGARIHRWGSWAGRAVVGGQLDNGGSAEAAVWFDDPTGWRAVRLDAGSGYSVAALLDLGERLLVVGRADAGGPTRGWSSSDGRTWRGTALDAIGGGYIGAYAGRDPTVLVVDNRSLWASES